MSRKASELQRIIEPTVTAMGYELLGIEHLSQGRRSLVRIYIDSEQGITLDDCEAVSHQVSGMLDVEDPIRGQYALEISSPGLDRPLFKREHYERYVGNRVRIRMALPIEGRRKFSGALAGVRGDKVIVIDEEVEYELPLSGIDKANLVPETT
ncbi:MAG: ribosome maturation factor RimP [Gammaproteobacteria bacterium]|nr:ribosome maturation factor RimP [Gammaproteobacteria bacterium]